MSGVGKINGINRYKISNASGIIFGTSNNIEFSIKVVSVDGNTDEQMVETGMQNLTKVFNISNSTSDNKKKVVLSRVK